MTQQKIDQNEEKKDEKKGKLRRGFAVMDPRRVKEIASLGGKAAHEAGTAHEFKQGREAEEAGRKGGYAVAAKRQATKKEDVKENTGS
jgi:general stress protein YciG